MLQFFLWNFWTCCDFFGEAGTSLLDFIEFFFHERGSTGLGGAKEERGAAVSCRQMCQQMAILKSENEELVSLPWTGGLGGR